MVRDWVVIGLNLAVAACALIAAALWYQSARKPLPQMVAYWDAAPEDDAFYSALRQGTLLNRLAARWAAASALFTAASALLPVVWRATA